MTQKARDMKNPNDKRYSRQVLLEEIELEGQRRLMESKVLVVGAGGLGSPASLYLAAAGVGTIGIVDADTVAESNLNRQILHDSAHIGVPKVDSAAEKLQALNPDVTVISYPFLLTADNAIELFNQYDFVLDCTDQFENKYLICDAAVLSQKPYSFGSVLQWGGQMMTYLPAFKGHEATACYRCLFPEPPLEGEHVPSCADAGILGAVAGVVGSLQAAEAIKFLTHNYSGLLTNKLLSIDVLTMRFSTLNVTKDKNCPLCSENARIKDLQTAYFINSKCRIR